MRMNKVCRLLLEVLLAAVVLLVSAAAVEVYDDDELEEALKAGPDSIKLMPCEYGYYLYLDDPIKIDFDTVLDLDGNELNAYFQITNGAHVTIKNGLLKAAEAPIIEVCGSDDKDCPTVLVLEDLRIEASAGIQIKSEGYASVAFNNTTIQVQIYQNWCLQIADGSGTGADIDVTVDGGSMSCNQGYIIECKGEAEVLIRNAELQGSAGILMQAGSLTMENTALTADSNAINPDIPTGAITFAPAAGAARAILTLGPGNQITSKNGAVFSIAPLQQGAAAAQIAVTGGTFIATGDHPLFSDPDMASKTVKISGGSFPGISPEDFAALAPCLAGDMAIDADGNVAAQPREPEVIIVYPTEDPQVRQNPVTGAAPAAIGRWISTVMRWPLPARG